MATSAGSTRRRNPRRRLTLPGAASILLGRPGAPPQQGPGAMALSRTTRVNCLIGTGHFFAHFYVLALPPLFLAWQATFHVSFAALGLVLALMSATTALLQTPVGFLVDRHGARPFLVGGALLMSLGITGMGFATSFWQILVFGV